MSSLNNTQFVTITIWLYKICSLMHIYYPTLFYVHYILKLNVHGKRHQRCLNDGTGGFLAEMTKMLVLFVPGHQA